MIFLKVSYHFSVNYHRQRRWLDKRYLESHLYIPLLSHPIEEKMGKYKKSLGESIEFSSWGRELEAPRNRRLPVLTQPRCCPQKRRRVCLVVLTCWGLKFVLFLIFIPTSFFIPKFPRKSDDIRRVDSCQCSRKGRNVD